MAFSPLLEITMLDPAQSLFVLQKPPNEFKAIGTQQIKQPRLHLHVIRSAVQYVQMFFATSTGPRPTLPVMAACVSQRVKSAVPSMRSDRLVS